MGTAGQVLGEGPLALGTIGWVDRDAPHLHAIGLKFRVGIAERGQLIGAVEGEAAGEEGQDEDLLALEVGELSLDAVGVWGVEEGGRR